MRRLVVLLALLLLVLPAAASSAQTVVRGSTLAATPFPLNQGNDCDAYFALGGPVNNPFGATTCTYTQGFVYGNADTDPRTGFVPGDGVINTVTVKVGANPAPLRFVILRQITNAQLGAVSGEPKCCFFVRETDPVQPAANTATTFTVNLPVENNRQPNIITQDAIGFSAPTGGTLPLAFVPGQFSPATFTPGGLTSSSFHPKLGPEHGANSGGAFASGHQGGLDILLQYTFTPAGGVVNPAVAPGGVPTVVSPVISSPAAGTNPAAHRHHDDRRLRSAPDRRRTGRRSRLPAGELPRHGQRPLAIAGRGGRVGQAHPPARQGDVHAQEGQGPQGQGQAQRRRPQARQEGEHEGQGRRRPRHERDDDEEHDPEARRRLGPRR